MDVLGKENGKLAVGRGAAWTDARRREKARVRKVDLIFVIENG
jgi:hypothetical protein